MTIKNRCRRRSHKHDGMGVRRIRTVSFSSDSAYDSVVYYVVKIRLSESEAEEQITRHVLTLCNWFSSSASACDRPTTQFSLDRKRRSRRKRNQNWHCFH